ncbi:MAG: metallophosphoesterase [Candidatus Micrarchaeia archaeon]
MKIAFLSDFHFGFNEDATRQAGEALKSASEKADAIILGGDLFDSRVPKQEVVYEAVKLLTQCKEKMLSKTSNKFKTVVEKSENKKEINGVPLLGIYGTHERRTKGLANIIQVLDSAGVMVNVHAAKAVVEGEGEKVAVQGMGGIPEEYAAKALEALSFQPVSGAFNIFVFHQTLRELVPVAEGISAADLPNGFDVYVDGHIHWAQELREANKTILLPGSTVVTQMKQTEIKPKGYYLYDTIKRVAEFVTVKTRPFEFVEVSFSEATATQVEKLCREAIAKAIEKHEGATPLVKLKVKGTLARGTMASSIDLAALEKEFAAKAILYVDKEFASDELREKIEVLRKARNEQQSARELGLEALRKKLARLPPSRVEELFALLSEGDAEKAAAKLLQEKSSAQTILSK